MSAPLHLYRYIQRQIRLLPDSAMRGYYQRHCREHFVSGRTETDPGTIKLMIEKGYKDILQSLSNSFTNVEGGSMD
ncbi:hypothetical protein PROFUN_12435 [Planoprotostelium fungivorum]|uniref:Complex 1 LYR protein domain-containing protein n=1 Tax=Planoprotostelium fungivorum TaxID=1890364 RepID=A0A2P6N5S8_9EUKA|nr:hypothetical protein PROFUN_14112 [Planoprotostelium fungivorum]PRP79294.1 hypothetical protein PROFUN_12435 [Planoprotostelium fungivorum]